MKLRYSIKPGRIERLTEAETHGYMDEAIKELENYCDVQFTRVKSGGSFRFDFVDEWDMRWPALGNAFPSGTIHLAARTAQDRWRMDLPFRRTLQTVTQHEIIAHPPFFNFGHKNRPGGLLGTNANSDGPLPSEVLLLQEYAGLPKKQFYPIDRFLISKRRAAEGVDVSFQRLKDERDDMIAAAVGLKGNAHADAWRAIHAKHKQVVKTLQRVHLYNGKWWAANNHWKNIPMAITS